MALLWGGPRVQGQMNIRSWSQTSVSHRYRKMKNSETNHKLKKSCKNRNKNSKTLEQNSNVKPRNMDLQVAHKFQYLLHHIHRQVELPLPPSSTSTISTHRNCSSSSNSLTLTKWLTKPPSSPLFRSSCSRTTTCSILGNEAVINV